MPVDYDDFRYLMQLEELIEEVAGKLESKLKEFIDLKIVLLYEFVNYKDDIKDTLSFDNKLIKLMQLGNDKVKDHVVEYFRIDNDVKRLKIQLQQVQGKRDSIKKKASLTPQ